MKYSLEVLGFSLVAVIICVSFLGLPCMAVAQQNPTAFEKAISKDVVAVASVSLIDVDLPKLNNWGLELGLFSKEETEILKLKMLRAHSAVEGLSDSGVERISVLFRLSDFGTYSPLWVATVKKEGDVAEATEALKATLDILQLDKRALKVRDGLIFGGPSQAEIDSLFAENAAASRELSESIKILNQHTAGFVVFGNQDTRRVVREMFPDLPQPFKEATRDLIADHTDWGGVFLDLPPTVDLKLIVQARDNDSAQTLGRLSTGTIEYVLKKSPPEIDAAVGRAIRLMLVPEVTDRRVVLDFQKLAG